MIDTAPQAAFSRLPVSVDLTLLLQALAQIDSRAWTAHFNTGYYQGDWSGVALISPADARVELGPGAGAAVKRDAWVQDTRWATALRGLDLDIRTARLLRLGPGGRIHEHRDYDLGVPDADRRLHIPLLSPGEVDFMLDGQRIPMQAGELWFLDLARPHSVDNWDTTERVHLVLDCRPNDWLLQQIEAGLASTPPAGIGRAARDFARLRELLVAEPLLSQRLQTLTDPDEFIERTVQLGVERGLCFGAADVRAAMRAGRRRWSDQWKA